MPRSELVNDMKMNAVFRGDGSIEHRFAHHSARETTGSWPEPEIWKRGDTLGKGAFGVVYVEKCVSPQQPPRFRAVKVISNGSDPSTRHYVDQELEAIAKFSQPKYTSLFVQCLGWFEILTEIYITMEHIQFGDLQSHLKGKMPEGEAQRICAQLLQGIQCLHENNFVHRDLKPENIFVKAIAPKWHVKIGDFGISKKLHENTALRSQAGTPLYCAPEVTRIYPPGRQPSNPRIYTNRVDIWSLGVMLFYLFTHKYPFLRAEDLELYVEGSPLPSLDVSRPVTPEGQNFLRLLLTADATTRPSAKEALQDIWFKQRSFDLVSDPSRLGLSTRLMIRQESTSTASELLDTLQETSRGWYDQEVSSVMGEQTMRPADVSRSQVTARKSSTSSNQTPRSNPPDRNTFHTEGFSLPRHHDYASADNIFQQGVETSTRHPHEKQLDHWLLGRKDFEVEL